MQTEVFLRLFTGLATQDKPSNFAETSTNTQQHDTDLSRTNSVKMGRKRIIAEYQRLKLWQRLVLAILVVALLGWGSFAIYTHTPAWAATITIMPVTKTLNQGYEIGVSEDGATVNTIQANTIKGHKISFKSAATQANDSSNRQRTPQCHSSNRRSGLFSDSPR